MSIPGAHWQASLPNEGVPGSLRALVSKIRLSDLGKHPMSRLHTHIHKERGGGREREMEF